MSQTVVITVVVLLGVILLGYFCYKMFIAFLLRAANNEYRKMGLEETFGYVPRGGGKKKHKKRQRSN